MTKKRKQPSLEELLERPWCFYCERDFDDVKILINHQKAKHLKCSHCTRRLGTAGGLSVHMQQVHKETLTRIENALPGREDPNVEIFAMTGVPEDVLQVHNQRVTEEYYASQADHRERTGNFAAGDESGKKPKIIEKETPEEIKKRLAEWRAKKAAGELGNDSMQGTPSAKTDSPGNAQVESPYPPPVAATPPAYHQVFAQPPPAASPPVGYPPYGVPPGPFQQYPAPGPAHGMPSSFGAPVGYPPFAGSPPPGPGPPHMAQFPPQPFGQPYPAPTPPTNHGFPPRQNINIPPHHGPPVNHNPPMSSPAPHHSPSVNAPPRQNSLPTAPGLPARPSFDAPQVSRHQLHEMHQGQKPVDVGQTVYHPKASNTGADIDELIQAGQQDAAAKQDSFKHEAKKYSPPPVQPAPVVEPVPVESPIPAQANGHSNGTPVTAPVEQDATPSTKVKKPVVVVVKDKIVSAEEKMAKMSRYSFTPR